MSSGSGERDIRHLDGEQSGGFLGRWSRLKQEAARGEETVSNRDDTPVPEADVPPANGPASGDGAGELERIASENQAYAESIDIDLLDFSSDYTAFLKQGVSRELRRQALRRLWTSDPVLACVDGLNDYDEDFRSAGVLAEGFRSSWQVGRGFGWMDDAPSDDQTCEADAADAGDAADDTGPATGDEDATSMLVEADAEHLKLSEADGPAEAGLAGEPVAMVAGAPSPTERPRVRQADAVPVSVARRRMRFD